MRAGLFRHLMNLWPPFLVNAIRVTALDEDWRHAQVRLKLRPWNRNYVGTQFGGNLFAMTDPFWMLLVMHNLGPAYYVWDQAGEITFLKPGRGTVHADFRLDPARIDDLKQRAAGGRKVLAWFETALTTDAGEPVARVRKCVYVRLKPARRPALPPGSPRTLGRPERAGRHDLSHFSGRPWCP